MRRLKTRLLSLCLALSLTGAAEAAKIYALKYGESTYKASLVNTLAKSRLVRLNWLFYVIETGAPAQYTLIDTGFSAAEQRRRFGLTRYNAAESLLQSIGLKPEMISRVILTHTHFDHAGNLALFPRARITLHAAEYEALSDRRTAAFLAAAKSQGLLDIITASRSQLGDFEIIHTGGHTPGSIAIQWRAPKNTFVFTGDECYFAAACRAGIPLPKASAFSVARNTEFIRALNPQHVLLTGHETEPLGGKWINDNVYLIEAD